jgi:hypothetical protein
MSNNPEPPNQRKPRFQIQTWILLAVLMVLTNLWFIGQTPTLLSDSAESPISIPYSGHMLDREVETGSLSDEVGLSRQTKASLSERHENDRQFR